MGLLPLTYRRPPHVQRMATNTSQDSKSDTSLKSGRSSASAGIPPALSFDKIIEGGTCPPCTVRDFMNYLIYVERSAENLQFFLWYRGYVTRFNQAPESARALAPEWTQAQEDEALARIQKETADRMRGGQQADMFHGTDFEKPSLQLGSVSTFTHEDCFTLTPPESPVDKYQESMSQGSNAGSNTTSSTPYRSLAGDAYTTAGAKQPFTIQPFRTEIHRVIATYIADRSPRQLNLSSREQKSLLHALSHTTHPTAFRTAASSTESSLRHQSHPNFIRWSIRNGNPARTTFARCLGLATIALSTALAVVLTLSRALAAVGWVVGFATLAAAAKGMCVVLHGLHHRHVRPWELFDVDSGEEEEDGRKSSEGGRFDPFGCGNGYEDEPWVVRYQKRNLVRKVFDREVWILEPALRRIQDTIFVQSLLGAVVLAGVLAGVFVCVPSGGCSEG